ncbi:MAG: PcfK-like family protein [Bacteroidaceae bacterium]|nr:PcfK-like family protein [Bacteroidaceae bacterium]
MKTVIKTYLENRAAADPQFAARYANPKKSIEECCKYITGEAYAKAKNGVAVLSDDAVFGLAVHYYDEDSIVVQRTPSATSAPQAKLSKADREKLQRQAEAEYKAKVTAELKKQELARKQAQKEKAKAKREQEEAMFAGSLFD